jgi:hypothetical protein
MVSAISVGVAARFTGTLSRKFALPSPLPVNRLSISVSTGPGATALTRTPLCAPSSAAVISPHALKRCSRASQKHSLYLASRLSLGPIRQRPRRSRVAGRLMKLPASGLLMSDAKLFHYVFSVALMILEYLQTAL